jgi:(p)ppGpp synthase/HD superfamily hydrolase
MEWTVPAYKRGEVDLAGRLLVKIMKGIRDNPDQWDPDEWYGTLDVINNWRAAHAYPLNIFQDSLRKKARRIDSNAAVAQRTKRLWSIWHKLDRFKTMQLSQMQDIRRRVTDYIRSPRGSGYRGLHVIWENTEAERRSLTG